MEIYNEFGMPELQDNNPKIRLEAVKKIDNQQTLEFIAKNDPNEEVRFEAVENIKDEHILFDIVKSRFDLNISCAAIKSIYDENILEYIAKNDVSPYIRMKAMESINDKSILKDIFKNDPNPIVRQATIKHITEDSSLYFLIENCKNMHNDDLKSIIEYDFIGVIDFKPISKNNFIKILKDYCSNGLKVLYISDSNKDKLSKFKISNSLYEESLIDYYEKFYKIGEEESTEYKIANHIKSNNFYEEFLINHYNKFYKICDLESIENKIDKPIKFVLSNSCNYIRYVNPIIISENNIVEYLKEYNNYHSINCIEEYIENFKDYKSDLSILEYLKICRDYKFDKIIVNEGFMLTEELSSLIFSLSKNINGDFSSIMNLSEFTGEKLPLIYLSEFNEESTDYEILNANTLYTTKEFEDPYYEGENSLTVDSSVLSHSAPMDSGYDPWI